ncbi:MAG TPA: carboxypeptidase-like regulatory domain-containing protein [Candidatus Acidoferrales bacterium]|nr:carboxypeptidase-like regulatory domain-containing protein [Candidatus Acidoferrales bacterium]
MRTTRIAPSVMLLLAIMAVSAATVRGQSERDRSQLRTVHGSVMDHSDNPIPNGVVYLLNKKTHTVRTYIADPQGHYQFSGLDPNVDFEIHAEYKHHKSSRRTISSFDDRRDIEINLTIATD